MRYKGLTEIELGRILYDTIVLSTKEDEKGIHNNKSQKKERKKISQDMEKENLCLCYEFSHETKEGEWFTATLCLERLGFDLMVEKFESFDKSKDKFIIIINEHNDEDSKYLEYFRKVQKIVKNRLENKSDESEIA